MCRKVAVSCLGSVFKMPPDKSPRRFAMNQSTPTANFSTLSERHQNRLRNRQDSSNHKTLSSKTIRLDKFSRLRVSNGHRLFSTENTERFVTNSLAQPANSSTTFKRGQTLHRNASFTRSATSFLQCPFAFTRFLRWECRAARSQMLRKKRGS